MDCASGITTFGTTTYSLTTSGKTTLASGTTTTVVKLGILDKYRTLAFD